MVRKLRRETRNTLYRLIGIGAQLASERAPVVGADVAQPIFAANFHGNFDAINVDVVVGENAGHVVKGGQPDAAGGANEQSIVLGMGIRARDKPVEDDGIESSSGFVEYVLSKPTMSRIPGPPSF